jgi:hypothetical protein
MMERSRLAMFLSMERRAPLPSALPSTTESGTDATDPVGFRDGYVGSKAWSSSSSSLSGRSASRNYYYLLLFIIIIFAAKHSPINHYMNSNDEMWQMLHFVLCQELDAIKDDIGCTGTPCRKHYI